MSSSSRSSIASSISARQSILPHTHIYFFFYLPFSPYSPTLSIDFHFTVHCCLLSPSRVCSVKAICIHDRISLIEYKRIQSDCHVCAAAASPLSANGKLIDQRLFCERCTRSWRVRVGGGGHQRTAQYTALHSQLFGQTDRRRPLKFVLLLLLL